jgi:hypothetical protein
MNKKLMYGIGLIAVIGIAYYVYNKGKGTTTSESTKKSDEIQEPTPTIKPNIPKGVKSKIGARIKRLKESGKLTELQQQK